MHVCITPSEWALDVDIEVESESDHAHMDPLPAHPTRTCTPTTATTVTAKEEASQLVFSIGKKYMTAAQFLRKVVPNGEHHSLTEEEFIDGGSEVRVAMNDLRQNAAIASKEQTAAVDCGVEEDAYLGRQMEGEGGREMEKRTGVVVSWDEHSDYETQQDFSLRQLQMFLKRERGTLSAPAKIYPEASEILRCLRENVGSKVKRSSAFSTVPSVLGSTVAETQERIHQLKRLGFSRNELETVLLAFPHVLEVDLANVSEHSPRTLAGLCIP